MEKILEIKNISKQFSGVKALDDVSFDIMKGTCHCLIGENGAGKSTLIKILTGAHPKTSGEILFNGKAWNPANTRESRMNGIGCIFQELNVVEKLKVEENIRLGMEETRFGIIKKSKNDKVFEVLKRLDDSIDPHAYMEELSTAKRQICEMAKALAMESQVLILDEPTASLTEAEVRKLFEIIGELKSQGITIIYISHRLEEILELADYVTCLRDGKHVGTVKREDIKDRQELIRMMIGKVVAEDYVPNKVDQESKLIELKGVHTDKLHDINFCLHKGEILGFYGLMGAGKTEISRAIFGADPYAGEIYINGELVKITSPQKALSHGVALVPEERRTQGCATALSIAANTPMMNYKNITVNGLRSGKKEEKLAEDYVKRIGTACRNVHQSVAYLSGGNQQKVVISKCLNAAPQVLLLDEPTRGVDVGAKQEIYRIIRSLVSEGCSAIVFSSELPEILGLCDRIGLLFDGRIVKFIDNGPDVDSQEIMHIVTGGEEEQK